MNLYEILGLNKDASSDKIRSAYRKKAQKCHPDKAGGDKEEFQRILNAYSILSDSEKRIEYDTTGSVDPKKLTVRDRAISEVANLLFASLQQIDFKHTDLIKTMKSSVQDRIRQVAQARVGISKHVERNNEIVNRISTSSMTNILADMLNADSREQEDKEKQLALGILVFNEMLAVLADYSYMCDKQAEQSDPYTMRFFTFGGIGGAGSTS
jgi:curved DNA-binding protein CbpA